MSTAQDKLHAQANTLRKKLADAEAVVDQLRAKLALIAAFTAWQAGIAQIANRQQQQQAQINQLFQRLR